MDRSGEGRRKLQSFKVVTQLTWMPVVAAWVRIKKLSMRLQRKLSQLHHREQGSTSNWYHECKVNMWQAKLATYYQSTGNRGCRSCREMAWQVHKKGNSIEWLPSKGSCRNNSFVYWRHLHRVLTMSALINSSWADTRNVANFTLKAFLYWLCLMTVIRPRQ